LDLKIGDAVTVTSKYDTEDGILDSEDDDLLYVVYKDETRPRPTPKKFVHHRKLSFSGAASGTPAKVVQSPTGEKTAEQDKITIDMAANEFAAGNDTPTKPVQPPTVQDIATTEDVPKTTEKPVEKRVG